MPRVAMFGLAPLACDTAHLRSGYLVYLGQELVGTFSMRQFAPNLVEGAPRQRTYISSLGLLEEHRGQGLGMPHQTSNQQRNATIQSAA